MVEDVETPMIYKSVMGAGLGGKQNPCLTTDATHLVHRSEITASEGFYWVDIEWGSACPHRLEICMQVVDSKCMILE